MPQRKKPATKAAKSRKVSRVMGEFKAGKLHSGSKQGPEVTDPQQAIAIAMGEAGIKKKRTAKRTYTRKRAR
jgi:Family of unknown function (DUF6496)